MNVLNDNWLFVRYNTGKIKQISIRQAFKDAEKITDIETPTFHNTQVSLYDVPVIQFLSILLLSAYFKPSNKFAAASKQFNAKLTKDGWDDKILTKYFDKWEDRFNLFDGKYPFLQDIRLKSEINNDNKKKKDSDEFAYISRSNLIAPGGNNVLFEHNSATKTSIIDFKPTNDELVYILLYLRSLGTSPMAAQYPYKAMASSASMFIINKGKNLKETIIANCLPLRDSTTDEYYDRPIWELDNPADVINFDITEISKNVLLSTYFLYPIYVRYEDNDIKDIILAKSIKSDAKPVEVDENGKKKKADIITAYDVFNGETRRTLAETYPIYNPWAIRRAEEKNDTITWKYKDWTNDIKLLNLCIEITKHTPSGCGCNLINTDFQANDTVNNVIYYREYDDKKCNIFSFGKYNIDKGILTKLQNEKNHEKAQEFQDMLNNIQNKFFIFKESELPSHCINDCKLQFSKYAEHYFFSTFVKNINKKNCVNEATEDFINEVKKTVKRLEAVTKNPLKYAEAYRKFCGSLNKLKEGT